MAKYFDGKSAQSHDVSVQSDDRGLTGYIAGAVAFIWPFKRVEIASKPDRGRDAILSYKDDREARLHLNEAEYASLKTNLKGGNWFGISLPSIMIMLAVTIGFVIGMYFLAPKAVRPLAKLIPYSWEKALSEEVYTMLARNETVCKDEAGMVAMYWMLGTLRDGADIDNRRVKITVLDSYKVNAFALPADHMVFYRGLIDQADSPEEVAAVMAHELAHIEADHPMEGLVTNLGMTALVSLMFGGAGSIETLAATGQIFYIFKNNREAEREADSLAISYMEASNVNPQALADFFAKMKSDEEEMEEVFDLNPS